MRSLIMLLALAVLVASFPCQVHAVTASPSGAGLYLGQLDVCDGAGAKTVSASGMPWLPEAPARAAIDVGKSYFSCGKTVLVSLIIARSAEHPPES